MRDFFFEKLKKKCLKWQFFEERCQLYIFVYEKGYNVYEDIQDFREAIFQVSVLFRFFFSGFRILNFVNQLVKIVGSGGMGRVEGGRECWVRGEGLAVIRVGQRVEVLIV